MATIGEILVKIGVNSTALKTGLAAARGDLTAFGGSMGVAGTAAKDAEGKFGGLGSTLGRIAPAAQLLGGVVVGAVAGIGVEAVHSAETFQTSMTGIQNNLNLSGAQAQAYQQAIEQASLGTDSSANTMAAALVPVAGELNRVNRGGLDVTHMTQQLAAAQNLHEASNTDLATSLKAITDLELVYHQGTSQAANDATLLFAAQSQLGIGTDTLAGMMQKLQPKIAGANLSLAQTLGIAREMEPVMGTGTRAITTTGVILQAFVSPTAAATKALRANGVSLTDAKGKFIGMGAAVDAVRSVYDRLPVSVAAGSKELTRGAFLYQLFGKNAAAAQLLIAGGSAGIKTNSDALLKNGTAAQAAERNSKTLADQEETLKATMSTMATTLGTAIIPTLSKLASAVLPIVQGIATWISQNPQLAATILGIVGGIGALLAATAVLAPAFGAVGAAIGAVGTVAGALAVAFGLVDAAAVPAAAASLAAFLPIIVVIGAVGIAVVLLVTHFQQVSAIVSAVVSAAIGFLRNLVSAVTTTAGDIITTILAIPGRVLSWGSQIVAQAVSAGAKFVAAIITMAGQVAQTILGLPGRIGGALVAGFATLAQNVVKAFIGGLASLPSQAAGILGHIPGVGLVGNLLGAIPHLQTGADFIPQDMLALIHQGEMVLPASQANILRSAQTVSAGSNTMASALKAGTAKAGVQTATLHVSEAESAVHAAQVKLAETLAKRNVKEAAILSAQDTLQRARDRLIEAHTKLSLAEEKLAAAESPTATRTATRATRGTVTAATGAATTTDPVVTLLQQILVALRATRPLVENMTINNPAPEPAGVSIANELRGIGQLGLGSQAMPVPAGTVG